MGGGVEPMQQQVAIAPDPVVPVDNQPTWQTMVGDWLSDLMSQQIPGSVVLLIVVVAFAPRIIKAVAAYLTRRRSG